MPNASVVNSRQSLPPTKHTHPTHVEEDVARGTVLGVDDLVAGGAAVVLRGYPRPPGLSVLDGHAEAVVRVVVPVDGFGSDKD